MHPVSEPACPHLVHALHPVDMKRRVLDLGQDARFDAVEQAQENRPGSILDDEEDRHSDGQSDQRIEDRHPDPNTNRPDEHGEGGEAINSRVLAIGDESC